MRERLHPIVIGGVVIGSVVIGSVVILGHLYGEQLTSAGQVPDAPTIGKEAVMADAVEA
jgi:hypothetical protein